MGFLIEWSPEAVEDLELIGEYISRDSMYYARSVIQEILATARGLSEGPFVGRIVPEMNDDSLREKFIYSYRLIYRIEKARILVIAVIHGKRLLDNIPDRF